MVGVHVLTQATAIGGKTMTMFTLIPSEVTELFMQLQEDLPSSDVEWWLWLAGLRGKYRGTLGKWLVQLDHAGNDTYTVTIHARRTVDR